jgi:hypothetical protein
MHCALPPSEPPDGERPCCFRLAAVGGAQPRGGRHPSAIARLQGFSSGTTAAFPHQWSRRMVTTGSMVGRSKLGCGLRPALNFKDLHHPCWGEASRGSTSRMGRWATSSFSIQGRGRSPAKRRGGLRRCGAGQPQASSAPAYLARWLSWLWRCFRYHLPPLGRSVAVRSPWGGCCVVHTEGSSKTLHVARAAFVLLDRLVLAPARRLRAEVGAYLSART